MTKRKITVFAREGFTPKKELDSLIKRVNSKPALSIEEAESLLMQICEPLSLNIDNIVKTDTGFTLGDKNNINVDFYLTVEDVQEAAPASSTPKAEKVTKAPAKRKLNKK